MGTMRKFESSNLLAGLSEERIVAYAGLARMMRARGKVVREKSKPAFAMAWVIRKNNVLRADNRHVLDEILPVLPPEISVLELDEPEPLEEESVAEHI